MRTAALATLLVLLGCYGCSSEGADHDDTTEDGVSSSDGLTGGDAFPGDTTPDIDMTGKICVPGSVQGCSLDGLSEVVCVIDGSGWVEERCMSESGGGVCIGGKCASCTPGQKKCGDEDTVVRCTETGEDWETYQSCNGAVTGQVCQDGVCIKLCELSLKWSSYMGCEYWGADLDNAFVPGGEQGYYDAQGSQYAIVVSNPNQTLPAEVTIYKWDEELDKEVEVTTDSSGNPFPTDQIMPGELRIYNLERRDINGTEQAPKAYRISSSVPITAYQFNPLENVNVFSNDASLLLPTNVAGKFYIVMTREQTFETLRSYVTVLALNPDTDVSIQVTAPTLAGEDGLEHLEPGDTINRTMQRYDILNIETDVIGADMTGTTVLSTKPVIVFGGSEASNAPNTNHCGADGYCEYDGETPCVTHSDCIEFNTCCADHLEQQLFPIKTWGKHYLGAKSYPRGEEKDVYRIIAALDNTQITTLPIQANIPVLNKGEWFDFETDEHFEIIAKKPIMVGQFLPAQDAPDPNVNGPQIGDAAIGDPAFILVVPTAQFRPDYVFLAPNKYELDYVTIVAPVGAEVLFDDEEIDPMIYEPVGTGEYQVARFAIEDGTHTVYADEPVGVYVYGYDQYVSYGYPAGLDLKDLEFLTDWGQPR